MKMIGLILCSMATALVCGCTGGSGGASLKQVGTYSRGTMTSVSDRPRLGMASFKVEGDSLDSNANLGDTAADQMGQLLVKTNRFNVVNRAEFTGLLENQRLADVVRPGQFMRAANIDGVDYVLVGTVTNLKITKKLEEPDMMKKVTDFVKRSADNKQVVVSATCGVGFQIIDPATRDIVLTNNSELDRTGGAADMGLDLMAGEAATPGAELSVSREDRVQIMRLALDDAIRKSLPKIDRFLQSQSKATAPTTAPVAPAPQGTMSAPVHTAAPSPVERSSAPAQNVSKKVCPVCGEQNDPSVKFCKKCGAKL
ncbi:hypothetical protein BH09PLA1_BH09PLA1_15240 [soil metagenome]